MNQIFSDLPSDDVNALGNVLKIIFEDINLSTTGKSYLINANVNNFLIDKIIFESNTNDFITNLISKCKKSSCKKPEEHPLILLLEFFIQTPDKYGLDNDELNVCQKIIDFGKKRDKRQQNTLPEDNNRENISTNNNSFIVGKSAPLEKFIGREKLIGIAFDQINNSGNLAIQAGMGLGKTSFLKLFLDPRLWQKYNQDYSQKIIIYCDCLSIYPFKSSDFWHEILRLIEGKLQYQSLLKNKIREILTKDKNSKDDLLSVLQMLGEQNQFLLLLIDNYEESLRLDKANKKHQENQINKFLSECRTLGSDSRKESKYISIIITYTRSFDEVYSVRREGSPWYNHYLYQQIKPFNEKEVDIFFSKIKSELR